MVVAGNGLFYPILGFVSCVAFIYLSFGNLGSNVSDEKKLSFVGRNGAQFMLDGKAFYINGWNSYWLMDQSVDAYRKPRVRKILQAGAKMGLTVCRTWAFNDGEYNALQISPGHFNEEVFKALDHVIVEARQQGIRLLLCLVNNLQAYGGKTQYVKWAWEEGVGLSASNDSFFFDPSIRNYFKNYVKEQNVALLFDDTVIAQSISNELPKRAPKFHDEEFHENLKFVSKWMRSHIEDGDNELNKPVMFTEYGLSNQNKDFEPSQRERFYKTILDVIYKSAKKNRSGAGALAWQFLVEGMDEYNDEFGIVPWKRPSEYKIMVEQSCRLARLKGPTQQQRNLKDLCSQRK
ncbi:hypothetical protein C1H46_038422 [Malus baccata]|uniref:mannan endo-1,4-beta-mannosidase n=1 Tax=Malus baccata TaxID=106549 RepID=A0A540KP76_MALBA|nr:hypothetical protein C1H46_038422 [Malus baccata]